MSFGVAAYSVVRDTEEEAQRELARITDVKQSAAGYDNYQQWLAGTKLDQHVSLEDYSVSNRGLRSGLIGTPGQIAERVAEFEAVGVDLLLLQCSPQFEEMERFAEHVISRNMNEEVGVAAAAMGSIMPLRHNNGRVRLRCR
jgi:FMNH2-dependent dimethyl sulfone monooxygenase